ncbi:MAG: phenylalanine--tRNA ligase subunit beta [Nitrospirae bacterium]|nr:phenylalanine--tRNA ligase subunit beta [Nitrospirota bacterium]
MRISLEWIREFVDVAAGPEEIAHRLTMAGLEIEGMESIDGDVVMEVNVTPNRPDCLSMLGIAREVSSVFAMPLKLPKTVIDGPLPPSEVQVVIDDPDLCARYTGRSILGVTVGDSPEWMRKRLEKCGIRAINNMVDITNYVLLELGHPLHAFDADRISGDKIRVARAGSRRSIMTLDGADRKLDQDTLLIWDAEHPVAVAGIMGGEGSSVTESTKNIFLESAHFTPMSIRRSAKALGLKSESSYRFERGTDRVFLEHALNRAALLMAEIGGGTIRDIVDVYPGKFIPAEITVPFRKVNSLIGIDIPRDEIRRLLSGIGITTEDRGDEFIAFPPAFRGDISEAVDIIEEVARCYGYDRIPARIPRTVLSDGVLNDKERAVRSVREAIRRSGFHEVVNFSFMNSADLDVLSISDNDHEDRRKHVMLKNPLRQEECLMRTTLMPSLIRNFLYNHSRGLRDIRLFELSRVFIDWGNQLPREGLRLAGIFFQDTTPVIWKDTVPPFYLVKGAIEALFEEMRLKDCSFLPSGEAFLHSGKSADMHCRNVKIGYIGELGPEVIERLDIKAHKPLIIVFEIDVDQMLEHRDQKILYRQIPRYPAIERDIALILDDQISAAEVLNLFRSYRSDIIEHVGLFDYYKGKNIPKDKKSLGVRVTYRSAGRTLTENDAEEVHGAIVDFVTARTGATVRGAA